MIRTGYSFRHSVGHLTDVITRIKEIGWSHAPIVDRCSTFGFVEWNKLCKIHDLKPVFGVELAVTPQLGVGRPILDYWKFLAVDDLRPLHDLIELATGNTGRTPSITYKQAMLAPGLFKISGESTLLDRVIPQDDFFIGLSPATPRGLRRMATEAGHAFVAISCNRYPRAEDKEFYRVTIGKRSGKKVFPADTQTYPQHILSDDEWIDCIKVDNLEAINNRTKILDKCKATLKKATLLVPEKTKTLRELCVEGAQRLNVNLSNKIYLERLNKELSLIAEKQFEDYFYIISDMMHYARSVMVVGPARGSSCGSLVCYLLGITSIDPIPFNLLFERFIDTTRVDLPDIDLDFSDARRNMLFQYMEKKYGRERVARLGSVGTFQPKGALNQAGMTLHIPKWKLDKISESIIVRSGGDARAMLQLEDTLKETEAGRELLQEIPELVIASKMEGHPTNASQHAAGVVLTQEPVREFVAIDARTKSCMCDKYDAEALNLLKIDALGLTQLSIFERTLELIGQPPRSDFLEKIPLNDPKAINVLNKRHYAGVFQFMGGALKSLVNQIEIKDIHDMIAITALARPGPMATGGANSWVKRKLGYEPITYPHPILEPYLKDTLGIVIYQEQTMQIGREVGDLTWEQVSALRKAMSKSLGEEFFNQYGDPWKSAAIAKGVPEAVANKFWKDLCSFGSWAFNLSHAVAYGVVSYWCCWFKAHYPLEFAAATLDAETDPSRQIELLRELHEEGISYVPIDPKLSTDKWTPQGNTLIGPLTNIKGIGPKAVEAILDSRANGIELSPRHKKLLATARTPIDTLWPVGDRIKELHPDLRAIKIESEPTPIKDVQCGIKGDVVVLAVINKINPRDENETVNVAKRGGRLITDGKTRSLNMFFQDDSGEIFAKIHRFKFDELGVDIINRGRTGKALYAVKGDVPPEFRMIRVKRIKYLGDLEQEIGQESMRGGTHNKMKAGEQE